MPVVFDDPGRLASVTRPGSSRQGRVGASFGWTRRARTLSEITLRSALHDQDDNAVGYIPGSQLEMLGLKLRYDNEREKAWVQDFTLIDIMSLSPWDPWVRKPSWNLHTGVGVANDLDRAPKQSDGYYGLNGGSGAFPIKRISEARGVVLCAGRSRQRAVGGEFSGTITGSAAARWREWRWTPAAWWRIHFNTTYLNYPLGETGEAVKLQLIQAIPLGSTAQFRCTLQRQNAYKELLLSVLLYL